MRPVAGNQRQLQPPAYRFPTQLSLHYQQLLAEEQDLAVLVAPEQPGQPRIERFQEEQVEVVDHAGEGRKDEKAGQGGTRLEDREVAAAS